MRIDDIEKTNATIRHPERPDKVNQNNQLDYRDVTHADFKTKR